jgi:4a-hydroxytetrahydrobiopterin dehydratase
MSDARLSAAQIADAGLADWRLLYHALQTRFRTKQFAAGLRLLNAVAAAAEEANHHPDLDLRYGHLNIRLFSHDAGGVTERDVALARRISALAAEHGVTADPSAVSALEIALDTPDHTRIKPFWQAVLGYRENPEADDELRDDDADLPRLWFQGSGADEPRQRFHLDIAVPAEVAQARIDAAVAAGGQVVDTADTFVVLADPEGNKVCVCT